jgi:polyisoprenoid-binding protein YceI
VKLAAARVARVWVAALAALLAFAPARAEPLTYQLDPAASFVHFELLHFGTSTVRGRFGPVEGSVTLDRAAGRGELGLRIATTSLSTGVPVFDARVRQSDMLATEAFPEAFFVASRFRFDGDKLAEVRGEFTLRGVSQPLSLLARHFACREEDVPEGGRFEAEITRGDFGINYGLPFIANRVLLRIPVEGRRPIQPKR